MLVVVIVAFSSSSKKFSWKEKIPGYKWISFFTAYEFSVGVNKNSNPLSSYSSGSKSKKGIFLPALYNWQKNAIWLVSCAWLSVHINFNFLYEEGIRQKKDFENLYEVLIQFLRSTFNTCNDVSAWKLRDSTQRVWAPMCKSFGSNFHLKSNKLA